MPANDDPELLRLKEEALAARQRLERLGKGFQDPEVLRHAKDIWKEARAEAAQYATWHRLRRARA
jgi:hypothetical protein